jgi:hypothetical protein
LTDLGKNHLEERLPVSNFISCNIAYSNDDEYKSSLTRSTKNQITDAGLSFLCPVGFTRDRKMEVFGDNLVYVRQCPF